MKYSSCNFKSGSKLNKRQTNSYSVEDDIAGSKLTRNCGNQIIKSNNNRKSGIIPTLTQKWKNFNQEPVKSKTASLQLILKTTKKFIPWRDTTLKRTHSPCEYEIQLNGNVTLVHSTSLTSIYAYKISSWLTS